MLYFFRSTYTFICLSCLSFVVALDIVVPESALVGAPVDIEWDKARRPGPEQFRFKVHRESEITGIAIPVSEPQGQSGVVTLLFTEPGRFVIEAISPAGDVTFPDASFATSRTFIVSASPISSVTPSATSASATQSFSLSSSQSVWEIPPASETEVSSSSTPTTTLPETTPPAPVNSFNAEPQSTFTPSTLTISFMPASRSSVTTESPSQTETGKPEWPTTTDTTETNSGSDAEPPPRSKSQGRIAVIVGGAIGGAGILIILFVVACRVRRVQRRRERWGFDGSGVNGNIRFREEMVETGSSSRFEESFLDMRQEGFGSDSMVTMPRSPASARLSPSTLASPNLIAFSPVDARSPISPWETTSARQDLFVPESQPPTNGVPAIRVMSPVEPFLPSSSKEVEVDRLRAQDTQIRRQNASDWVLSTTSRDSAEPLPLYSPPLNGSLQPEKAIT